MLWKRLATMYLVTVNTLFIGYYMQELLQSPFEEMSALFPYSVVLITTPLVL